MRIYANFDKCSPKRARIQKIVTSVILAFSVEGPRQEPSQSGRSEPTADLAQPALSSRRAYIPAALTQDLANKHLVTQFIHDMRPKCEGLYIPRRGDA